MQARVGFGRHVVLSWIFFFSGLAFAVETECHRPEATPLPAALAGPAQADALSADVDRFLNDSASYLQCLSDHADNHQHELTDTERAELRQEQSSHTDFVSSYASRWNMLYGTFKSNQ